MVVDESRASTLNGQIGARMKFEIGGLLDPRSRKQLNRYGIKINYRPVLNDTYDMMNK